MVDYKVGDTVRRTMGRHNGMCTGDTAGVLAVHADEVTLTKYGCGHDPAKLIKCTPVFDPDVAAELRAEALAAIDKYNEHLALWEPLLKPLVLK